MTVDDLETAYRAMDKKLRSQPIVFDPAGTTSPEEIDRLARHRHTSVWFAKKVWEIGRDFGMDAALLFKLSAGAIDARR